jgi:hypothetical protein
MLRARADPVQLDQYFLEQGRGTANLRGQLQGCEANIQALFRCPTRYGSTMCISNRTRIKFPRCYVC